MGAGEGQQGARQHTYRAPGQTSPTSQSCQLGALRAPRAPHRDSQRVSGQQRLRMFARQREIPSRGQIRDPQGAARSNRQQRKRVVRHLLPPAQARELAPSRKTSAPHAPPSQETGKHHASSFPQSRSGAGRGAARRTRLPRPRRRGSRRGRARGPRRACARCARRRCRRRGAWQGRPWRPRAPPWSAGRGAGARRVPQRLFRSKRQRPFRLSRGGRGHFLGLLPYALVVMNPTPAGKLFVARGPLRARLGGARCGMPKAPQPCRAPASRPRPRRSPWRRSARAPPVPFEASAAVPRRFLGRASIA